MFYVKKYFVFWARGLCTFFKYFFNFHTSQRFPLMPYFYFLFILFLTKCLKHFYIFILYILYIYIHLYLIGIGIQASDNPLTVVFQHVEWQWQPQ